VARPAEPAAGRPAAGTSHALLIGVSEFDDGASYQPLPSTSASVQHLAKLLHSSAAGSTPWHTVTVLDAQVKADDARHALREAVSTKLDTLLLCISTHGHRYSDDGHHPAGLYLAMSNSYRDLRGTHWSFDEVRDELAAASGKVRHIALIVDACWADGVAVQRGQGTGQPGLPGDRLDIPGVVVLSATEKREMAWPHWPGEAREETPWTAFLGALIESIEDGVGSGPETLTVGDVFWEARRKIRRVQAQHTQIPLPQIHTSGMAEFPLCRNNGYRPAVTREAGRERAPTASGFADAEACFRAIVTRQPHPARVEIPGIVRDFCGRPGVAENEVAVLIARLRDGEFRSYLTDAYAAACAQRSPADIATFMHCLLSNGVPVRGEILAGLRQRPGAGRFIAELYQILLGRKCADCEAAAEVLAAEVLHDQDRSLAAAVLAVWR
jgi:hypothetical protein